MVANLDLIGNEPMAFKVGDKVKMIDQRLASGHDVWGVVGVVTELIDDGTALKRIDVEFPGDVRIRGMVSGQFELA